MKTLISMSLKACTGFGEPKFDKIMSLCYKTTLVHGSVELWMHYHGPTIVDKFI